MVWFFMACKFICGGNVKRDYATEKEFLSEIVGLDYALLQRDWDDHKHGDLDFILSSSCWPKFIDRLLQFSAERGFIIIQAYEIESGVVCIEILTTQGYLHLDMAITPFRNTLFKIDLAEALAARELIDGVYMISQQCEDTYKINKKSYKRSKTGVWLMRLKNFKVLLERFINNLVFKPGLIIYIPYLDNIQLLKSEDVTQHVRHNLTTKLLNKYS